MIVAVRMFRQGAGNLRLVAVHGAPRFLTEWLAGDDPTWTSKR